MVELPKTEEGLGFNVMGGKEQNSPIYISRIIPGGVAFRLDCLKRGDQLLSVNGTVSFKFVGVCLFVLDWFCEQGEGGGGGGGGVCCQIWKGVWFVSHIWNSIPRDIRLCSTLPSFNTKQKTFLFSRYFDSK